MTHDLWLRRAGWLGMVAFVFGTGLAAHAQTKDDAPPKKAKAIAVSPEGTIEIEIIGGDIKVTGDGQAKNEKEGAESKLIINGKEIRVVEGKLLPGQKLNDKPNPDGKIITGGVEAAQKLPPKDKTVPATKLTEAGGGRAIKTSDGRVIIIREGKDGIVLAEEDAEAPAKAKPAQKMSEFYLGLECFPTDAAMRAQLNISDFQGLIVEQVVPDMPAAKAGIKHFDVLLTANDKQLADIYELMAAVDAAKGNEVALKLLRGGKEQTITVKPSKRPGQEEGVLKVMPAPNEKSLEQGLQFLQALQAAGGEGDVNPKGANLQFRVLNPGVMLPTTATFNELPDDMSITITRKGKNPAQIVVQQGEEKWEASEKNLDKLPEKVRGFVGPLVGRYDMLKFRTGNVPGATAWGQPQVIVKPFKKPDAEAGEKPNPYVEGKKPELKKPELKQPDTKPGEEKRLDGAVEKRFEAMQRQIEELRAKVEQREKELTK